jgi:hypothetical protein
MDKVQWIVTAFEIMEWHSPSRSPEYTVWLGDVAEWKRLEALLPSRIGTTESARA